ncbi:MAG: Asp-tRNA(Asn)/Glu-tRNA(Gln) amidotransferase subunit GatA [Candidatus Omnitrophica bacterium]|nr:Asp-tRNA(Asn)/Glu-tRNA(Gln) amidotransferase subunit GatA [Candidatus Omnitrophota bacterium]
MKNLNQLTAHKLLEMLKKEEITSLEIVQSLFERIEKAEDKIRAYLFWDKEKILAKAKKSKQGLLSGIPIAIKDNICVEGEPTGCASQILQGFISPYDATVVKNLKAKGAILCGRTNMDEFAFGSSTENSAYQVTHNPWDGQRVPGGSSGGSAAAVAADEAIFALGSDTGGSIRQPAGLCGVVGFKPTYGRVSRYGLIAFGSSLDQIGTLTKDVADAALLLKAIAGFDNQDSTSVDISVPDYEKYLEREIKGLKIGLPDEYFIEGLERNVKQRVEEAIKVFEGLGAEMVRISLPHTEFAVAVYYILATAEASSNLLRFDGVEYGVRKTVNSLQPTVYSLQKTENRKNLLSEMYEKTREEGFGKEAKRRIILGTYVLSRGYYDQYYLKAAKVRNLVVKDFKEAFEKCDLILTPTSPTPAWKIGEKTEDPLRMYLSDIFTIPANLAGIPAVSIPCGFCKGLPVGLQLFGKAFAEEKILQAAYAYEQSTEWHLQKPKI